MTAKLAATAAARPPSRQPIIGVKGKAAMRQHYGNDVRRGALSVKDWPIGPNPGRPRGPPAAVTADQPALRCLALLRLFPLSA